MNLAKEINILVLFVLLLNGCANQLPPDGGPVDITRPEIIYTYPENGTRNFKDDKIIIKFDRYVDERTFEESIFISPYIEGMEFDWSGKKVEISFSSQLRSNTTYVVNIGTDVKDKYRNYLNMANSYVLAFSTGEEIDKGYIKGIVFPKSEGDNVNGIMVFAYLITNENMNTLNPMGAKPDFITQTGKNGEFYFNHIPFGEYRIIAVKDAYRNLLYDKEVDEYGVQSELININPIDTIFDALYMRLTKEDTTGPVLSKVTAIDNNHLIADFSETIDPTSINPKMITIVDTIEQKLLPVFKAYASYTSSKSVIVICDTQDSTKIYRLIFQEIKDSVGNEIKSLMNSAVFQGSSKISPANPNIISVSVKDSLLGVELKPKIDIVFSEPINKPTSMDFIEIYNDQEEAVASQKTWLNDAVISITPENELASMSWYFLNIKLYKVKDWLDRNFEDSIKIYRFQTLDAEELSSINGMVLFERPGSQLDNLYVTAIRVDGAKQNYKVKTDKKGGFSIPNMNEGKYVVQAFVDRNNNGEYDRGKPYPFEYSEKLSVFSDTLKLRARWPLDGVIIKMR